MGDPLLNFLLYSFMSFPEGQGDPSTPPISSRVTKGEPGDKPTLLRRISFKREVEEVEIGGFLSQQF